MSPQNMAILKWFNDNPGKWLTTRTAMIQIGIGCLHKRISEIDLAKSACNKTVHRQWQTVKTRYGKTRVMGYRMHRGQRIEN